MADIYVQIKDYDGNFIFPATYTKNIKAENGETLKDIEHNAQANIIEDIKVNGVSQVITDKSIDLTIPDSEEFVTNEFFQSLNIITEETDPTVPDWAKEPTKPTYTKYEIGLGNVDDTADMYKPVSLYQQEALDLKANLEDVYTKPEIDNLLGDVSSVLDSINGEVV